MAELLLEFSPSEYLTDTKLSRVTPMSKITRSTGTLEEAQAKLPELIDTLAPGEEVMITRNQQPVAQLVGQQRLIHQLRKHGNWRGMVTIIADDDEHLEDFKDYMP